MSIEVVQAKLADIRGQLADIDNLMNEIQDDFDAVIKDKSIPLVDRWELFIEAPESFRGEHPWIWHPKCLEKFGNSGHEWEVLIYASRHQVIDLVEFINDVIDLREPHDDNIDTSDDVTRDDYIALMEEMLENNIGSFTFDW